GRGRGPRHHDHYGNHETTTSSKLPQTGQLNWPVPVLAVSGVVLFALGWGLSRSGRKREGYAK
ncbi:MAG: hypothetical protein LUG64_06230, partial [Clostridiales bacterium]|nr:hypothetical protein [Clostridiales bacterium]